MIFWAILLTCSKDIYLFCPCSIYYFAKSLVLHKHLLLWHRLGDKQLLSPVNKKTPKIAFCYKQFIYICIYISTIMDRLIEMYRKKLRFTSTAFIKSTMYEINWDARLIGIRGARGVGKTTLLLQHIKRNFPQDERTLYVSLDNIYFSDNRLYDFADRFVKRGGTRLYLDEVHKYPHWRWSYHNWEEWISPICPR